MYNTKLLRTSLREVLTRAVGDGWQVNHALSPDNASRYIVFSLQDLPVMDERDQLELEVNVVGPLSDSDTVEATSDAIAAELDREMIFADGMAFYLYRNTRNRVDGSDPHTVRYRSTFDLYLYERN